MKPCHLPVPATFCCADNMVLIHSSLPAGWWFGKASSEPNLNAENELSALSPTEKAQKLKEDRGTDVAALLELKQSVQIDSQKFLESWVEGEDPCSFAKACQHLQPSAHKMLADADVTRPYARTLCARCFHCYHCVCISYSISYSICNIMSHITSLYSLQGGLSPVTNSLASDLPRGNETPTLQCHVHAAMPHPRCRALKLYLALAHHIATTVGLKCPPS